MYLSTGHALLHGDLHGRDEDIRLAILVVDGHRRVSYIYLHRAPVQILCILQDTMLPTMLPTMFMWKVVQVIDESSHWFFPSYPANF